MTDRTRYDRTEEEAPLVPLMRGTEFRRGPNRPTTAGRTGYRTETTDPELVRELRTLRTQLDRIEAALQDDR